MPDFFCRKKGEPCLFHIPSDPCELKDIASEFPDIVRSMEAALQQFNETAVPILNKHWDPLANPKYWGYNYVNWLDYPPPKGVNVEKLRSDAQNTKVDYTKLFNFLKPKGKKHP